MFTPSTAKFFFNHSNPAIYQDWESFKLLVSTTWLALNKPIKFGAK